MSDASDASSGPVEVGTVDDVAPDDPIVATVDGRSVAVIQYGGELFAIRNECCHQGGPVGLGRVKGALTGDWPGTGERVEESFDEAVPAVACPWHGWEYELRTGEHLGDGRYALETYDVAVEDGRILVDR